jgi:hypothetical protein
MILKCAIVFYSVYEGSKEGSQSTVPRVTVTTGLVLS